MTDKKSKGHRAEGIGQMSEDRGKRTEVRSQSSVFCIQISVFRLLFSVFCLQISVLAAPCLSAMPTEQVYSLFSQANQFFREANAIPMYIGNDAEKAQKLYEKAILNYEKIISDGRIKNSKLYYNLGNAYFLKEDIGRAILNYRRAERLDKADTNNQKNLAFARSRRIDKVEVRTQERILETLFFWHYDFSIKTKFLITCICLAIVCISATVMLWRGKSAGAVATAVIFGLLTASFLTSVILETRSRASTISGVITAGQVVAQQGDGPNYPESFKDPLHAGTEFDLLEHRTGWFHIMLSDDSEGWIPDNTAELI
jgi:tetratricopeptide (TPR) repeat protein